MKYVVMTAAMSSLLFVAGTAYAKVPAINSDGFYVQGDLGSSKLKAEASYSTYSSSYSDNDTAFRVAAGKDFGNVRVALDYTDMGVLNIQGDWSAEITAKSVGISGIYDFNTKSAFTPYAGVRLGYNKVQLDSYRTTGTITSKESGVGFGALVGMQYQLNNNIALNANLEYNDLGKIDDADADVTNTGIYVGARYNF
ncbi:MAG: OmpW family outer membrane protein [Moraxella sp.]|nr:OmpW family outer membrane protein [Moraxella sp.]